RPELGDLAGGLQQPAEVAARPFVRVAQAVGHREQGAVLPAHPAIGPQVALVSVREAPAHAAHRNLHRLQAGDEGHQVHVMAADVGGRFPNGNDGYMWANGRVRFENNAILSVTNGLGYPDQAAGSNEQNLQMFFEGNDRTGMLKHDDQFRGVEHSYLEGIGCGGSHFNYVSPDFYRVVPWEGPGYKPIGYGFESIAAILGMAHRIENEVADLGEAESLAKRRAIIKEVDEKGIIATPANSYINELVVEAARLSILNNGETAVIEYDPHPHVGLRKF
ncbi:MAG: hypothetical protein HGA23_11755, partial [Bacteroidales bacterium]|nr:hypothetical protein [Bacteroidales bacterium]